ncbi:MAG: ATP-binding protein [Nanoarchaeota archaeon]|nr:ATP-binding protein [Nanoarchaeota archaeon]MBU1269693.1 ATP-binding protein [Nanoarchaeota archaeon]MBU1605125.1 ATP-binding protein [Nanoarchaeota archaeon]MBU2442922.1 ATP-binding protein [Nanoarchaeota archaeon]
MIQVLFKRKVVEDVLTYLNSKQAIILYGARQVGKTSIMKYLLKNYLKENAFYLDLELDNLLELCNKGPEQVYEYLLQRGAVKDKKIFLLIDEIQYLKDPTKFIKVIHDHHPEIKLIVSGSSTFEIRKKLKQSLAGRTITFEVYPLDFEEFLEFKEKKYALKAENSEAINHELISLAEEFITFGGYPGVVIEPVSEVKQKLLSQIINTYIRKDIRDIGNIRNIDSFNKLLELLAAQSGRLLNVNEVSNTLGIHSFTVREYLSLLENTFIIRLASPYHKNKRSELTKMPKVFLLDTGLMHLLHLKEFPKVISGEVFETFIFAELLKNKHPAKYWRTTLGQEVDFVIENGRLTAVEAKVNFQKVRKNALEKLAKEYPANTYSTSLQGKKQGIGRYPWELIKELENAKPIKEH